MMTSGFPGVQVQCLKKTRLPLCGTSTDILQHLEFTIISVYYYMAYLMFIDVTIYIVYVFV